MERRKWKDKQKWLKKEIERRKQKDKKKLLKNRDRKKEAKRQAMNWMAPLIDWKLENGRKKKTGLQPVSKCCKEKYFVKTTKTT